MGDHEVREREDVLPTPPSREAEESVHAEHETERTTGQLRTQLLERIDGERGAGAAHLAVVDHEAGLIGDRGAQHREPQLRRGERRFAVTRIAYRDPAQLGERQQLQQLETGAQMPEVDGVEGAAEDADRPGRCGRVHVVTAAAAARRPRRRAARSRPTGRLRAVP